MSMRSIRTIGRAVAEGALEVLTWHLQYGTSAEEVRERLLATPATNGR
jgi:hypothetical protein